MYSWSSSVIAAVLIVGLGALEGLGGLQRRLSAARSRRGLSWTASVLTMLLACVLVGTSCGIGLYLRLLLRRVCLDQDGAPLGWGGNRKTAVGAGAMPEYAFSAFSLVDHNYFRHAHWLRRLVGFICSRLLRFLLRRILWTLRRLGLLAAALAFGLRLRTLALGPDAYGELATIRRSLLAGTSAGIWASRFTLVLERRSRLVKEGCRAGRLDECWRL